MRGWWPWSRRASPEASVEERLAQRLVDTIRARPDEWDVWGGDATVLVQTHGSLSLTLGIAGVILRKFTPTDVRAGEQCIVLPAPRRRWWRRPTAVHRLMDMFAEVKVYKAAEHLRQCLDALPPVEPTWRGMYDAEIERLKHG